MMEKHSILKTPSRSHFSTPPRDHKYHRNNIIPCTLCNMEMSGPVSYQQHVEGRFHNALSKQRMLEVHLPYRSSKGTESWEHGHSPAIAKPSFCRPMYFDSLHYYQGLHNRSNSSYVSRQHSSRSIPSKSHDYTGLFYCQVCDTHHRSRSHYTSHLAAEHEMKQLERNY